MTTVAQVLFCFRLYYSLQWSIDGYVHSVIKGRPMLKVTYNAMKYSINDALLLICWYVILLIDIIWHLSICVSLISCISERLFHWELLLRFLINLTVSWLFSTKLFWICFPLIRSAKEYLNSQGMGVLLMVCSLKQWFCRVSMLPREMLWTKMVMQLLLFAWIKQT